MLPKSKSKIVDFALSLSEQQEKQFLTILDEFRFSEDLLKEFGKSGGEENVRKSFNEDEAAFFENKMGMKKEDAIEAAKVAFAEKAKVGK